MILGAPLLEIKFPFPKPIGSNVLAIGMHLFGMSYRGFV